MTGCCPHEFEETVRPGQNGQEAVSYRCERCGCEAPAYWVAAYRLGVEHGRKDAWSKPPRSKVPRWAVAAVVSLGLPLVGAGPIETLAPPPPSEGLRAEGRCLKALAWTARDVEILWGRQLGVRCKNDACRALARQEAEDNRKDVAASIRGAIDAHLKLTYLLEDAVPCAKQRIPGCADYMAPLLTERRAEVDRTVECVVTEIGKRRFEREAAVP